MTDRLRAVSYVAECAGCVTRHTGPNAQALAAVHHDRTGHVITVTRTVTYGLLVDHATGAGLEAAGQRTLGNAAGEPLELDLG